MYIHVCWVGSGAFLCVGAKRGCQEYVTLHIPFEAKSSISLMGLEANKLPTPASFPLVAGFGRSFVGFPFFLFYLIVLWVLQF